MSSTDHRSSRDAVAANVEPSDELQIVVVRTPEEVEDALSVRRTVFIAEQDVLEEEEIDAYDRERVDDALRVVAYLDGRAVATGRLLLDTPPGENAHIGRIAVLRELRRRGIGGRVMRALQDEARRRGHRGVTISAQLQAIPFYESLGYVAYGDVFLDARIEHRMMDLAL